MKTKTTFKFLLLLLALITISNNFIFAKNVKIDAKKSKVVVSGTSTLHDWKTKVLTFKGDLEVEIDASNKIETFKTVNLLFYSTSFSSGKSSMDEKTRDAVNAEKYPVIKFAMEKVNDIKSLPNKQMITVSGKLSIAGVTKTVEITAWGTINAAGEIVIDAKKEINLTDFGIAPPEIFFIKAGNKIEINLSFYLS